MVYILLNDPLQNCLDTVASFSTLSKTVLPITLDQMCLVIASGAQLNKSHSYEWPLYGASSLDAGDRCLIPAYFIDWHFPCESSMRKITVSLSTGLSSVPWSMSSKLLLPMYFLHYIPYASLHILLRECESYLDASHGVVFASLSSRRPDEQPL